LRLCACVPGFSPRKAVASCASVERGGPKGLRTARPTLQGPERRQEHGTAQEGERPQGGHPPEGNPEESTGRRRGRSGRGDGRREGEPPSRTRRVGKRTPTRAQSVSTPRQGPSVPFLQSLLTLRCFPRPLPCGAQAEEDCARVAVLTDASGLPGVTPDPLRARRCLGLSCAVLFCTSPASPRLPALAAHSTPPRWQPRATPRRQKSAVNAAVRVATSGGSGGD
jgi:hypothetical protein